MSEESPLFRTVQNQMSQDARVQTLESAEYTFDMRSVSALLQLPGLRGAWPMSAFGATGQAFDQSGNGRTLTYNGNPTYNHSILAPYISLDGTGDYLSRADEAGLDILGTETYVAAAVRGLTLGGWFSPTSIAAAQGLITKGTAGAAASSYELFLQAGGSSVFRVSTGAVYITATSTNTMSATTWQFVVGRYDPSTSVDVWLDNTETSTVVGVPAALPNTGNALIIGAFSGPALLFTGDIGACFLCAQYLSDEIIHSFYNQTRQLFQV